ncbi:sensor histidine kinase [Geothrix sp. PMB-07]|uniref:sensor histidine kinase n=1 Tax=Geothrix sp. PMB-07 TaxID=3068640 RepID=UPI002740E976|nr:histidine kinase [Geothrix sp. PMB-07]WLT30161.1 histidine kinase [Geothrix sp. PMB-07]
MHPLLASRARLGAYLLGWVPIALLLIAIARSQGWSWEGAVSLAVPLCLLAALLFLSAWFLCRALPLGRTVEGLGRHGAAWAMAAIFMGSLWSGLAWMLARLLAWIPGLGDLPPRVDTALPVLTGLGILLYLASVALNYLILAQERAVEAERKGAELQLLAQESELKALRAQLNPHFLFNSLNSLSALTAVDPARAREMCVLLSDFLRRSLGLGERRLVALREELDLAKAYLAIEQIRFGQRLQLAWTVDPAAEPALLPTLLLQPLVENAIKHGIAALPEGGVLAVSAEVLDGHVILKVDNPLDQDAPVPQGLGIGLRQVRQRLLGRFGSRARFEAGVREGVHHATLVFPLETEP